MKATVKVIEAWDETPSIRALKLAKPEGFTYTAGQYCFVTVGEDLKHSLSIASSPEEPFLLFATRKSESDFKKAYFALAQGSDVVISGPYGEFVLGNEQHVVMLSGGIGITPFKSMLEHFTRSNTDAQRRVTLIYGNRIPEEIPFHARLDEMSAMDQRIRIVHTVNQATGEWKGNVGVITPDLITKEIADWQSVTYYVCGPPIMVESLKKMLGEMGIAPARVKEESFSGY